MTRPLVDSNSWLDEWPTVDGDALSAVMRRAQQVLRPAGAIARLDEVAAWLAGWQRTSQPAVASPVAIVFAADHGVAAHGVSAYPSTVTTEMLRALQAGAATAAVMAAGVGAELRVVDVGVGRPTKPLHLEPALDPERFAASVELGRRSVMEVDADLLILGELGIGNTTAAAAVCAVLFGGAPGAWVGRGTGIDAAGMRRKRRVVSQASERIGAGQPPLEVLRQVGGAEMAAIAGAVVEARRRSIPVLLDGFVVAASVAPLARLKRGALDHCLAAHVSAEQAHRRLLARLGLRPLLDLGLRLGEGSGALAAVPLVRLAAACVTDVATFDEWGLAR